MKIKRSELKEFAKKYIGDDSIDSQNKFMIKIATARCARLSYMTFDGEIDYQKDIELHDRLLASHHMSPFEHCARAMNDEEYHRFVKGYSNTDYPEDGFREGSYGWCNNLKGFIPYRYFIDNNLTF